MKKIISGLLALALVAGGVAAPVTDIAGVKTAVTAGAATYGDLEYEVSGETITITKYNGTAETVEIPGNIGGKNVTEIGKEVFYENETIEGVVIPDSVTTIGENAFASCTSLSDVKLSNNLVEIGEDAFADCESLISIDLPNSLRTIKDSAFWNSVIESIVLPEGLKTIGSQAFCYSTALTEVSIPGTVEEIGSRAFSGIPTLKRITVNESNPYFTTENGILYSKDKKTLVCCPGGIETTDITVPENVSFIMESAFEKCDNIVNIIIPERQELGIDSGAFRFCKMLETVSIPSCVEYLDNGIFDVDFSMKSINVSENNQNYCSIDGVLYDKNATTLIYCPCAKESVTIPDTVTTIVFCSFADSAITSIDIPDSVTSIGDMAFLLCRSLTEVKLSKNITSLTYNTFAGCHSLKTIEIPEGVETIGDGVFDNCPSLTDVYYLGTMAMWNAININDSFNDALLNATIHCTDGTINEKTDDSSQLDDDSSVSDDTSSQSDDSSSIQDSSSQPDSSSTPDTSKPDSSKPDDSSAPDKPAPTPAPTKTPISKATVIVSNKTYTGKALKPAPTVTLDGKTLKSGTDYTAAYKNNKKCGKATVTVTGKGDYEGSKSGSFIIKPAKMTAKKLTSPKAKTIKLTWKKAKGGVTGYKVQIALDKKFKKSAKTYTVKKAAATSKTIKKLKSKKTYFVRVSAYKKVGKTTYAGGWSKVKKVKCK